MKQVRNNVFECNSSSTHSLTMCLKNEYDDWKHGKLYLNEGGYCSYSIYKDKNFITKDEAIDILTDSKYPETELNENELSDDMFEDILKENCIYTYDNYWNCYLEDFESEFTTIHGDTVIAFGQFGYNG